MKLLVTGAGGFLGSAVVRAAVEAGHDVAGFVRRPSERLGPFASAIRLHELSLHDREGVMRAIMGERPDAVVHTAWGGLTAAERSSAAQIHDNLLPFCQLVEIAAAAGVGKFVGIGSQAEYGRLDRPVDEQTTPDPTSLYGAAKLSACFVGRELAKSGSMSFAWMRLFATYGPGDNPNWLIPSLISQMRAGRRPQLSAGTQKWDYLFIDDAAAAVLAVASEPQAEGVFNLASGRPVQVRTVVEMIRDLVAPEMELVFGELPSGSAQITHMEGRIERLRAITGWAPRVTLEDGLRRTVSEFNV